MTHAHRCPVETCDTLTRCTAQCESYELLLCPDHEGWGQCSSCGEYVEATDDAGHCPACAASLLTGRTTKGI